jgi:hypothetical protein
MLSNFTTVTRAEPVHRRGLVAALADLLLSLPRPHPLAGLAAALGRLFGRPVEPAVLAAGLEQMCALAAHPDMAGLLRRALAGGPT